MRRYEYIGQDYLGGYEMQDVNPVAMVRLGFGDCNGLRGGSCLDFTVGFDDREKAYEAIRAIGPYNDFDPDDVIECFRELETLDLGLGGFGLSVGREGSPCIYVNRIAVLDDDARELRLVAVEGLLRKAGADEIDRVDGGAGCSYGWTVRAWWD